MGPTYKGGSPPGDASAQPSLFNDARNTFPEGNGAERDLSVNRDLPLQSQEIMQNQSSLDEPTRPVIVLPGDSEPLWARRLKLVIFVMFCVELGMALMYLPWSPVWTHNNLLVGHPALRAGVHHYFTRGAITGLGLVDMWIGIWAAVTYREKK